MKRLSLILCTIFALTPLFSIQQAYAMSPWRPKKADSLGRSIVLPWIRALKVPISVVGAVTCGVIGGLATANLAGAKMPVSNETGLPVSVSSVLYGLGLSYVASVLYSAIMHKETPHQQTQDLTERTVNTVQDTAVNPLKKATDIPASMIVFAIPAAALIAFFTGKDAILSKLNVESASKAVQALVAIFGIAGAMEYLRQLTDFSSNRTQ